MSNPNPEASESALESRFSNRTLTFIGAIGSILLFGMVLWIAYLPNRAEDPLQRTAEERLQILRNAREAAASKVDTLEVVDAENGVYKIPLSRAMEVTLKEYQQKQQNP